MTGINFRVPRPALEIFRFTTTFKERPPCSLIHFELEDERKKHRAGRVMHAVATNSYTLIHLEWNLGDDDKFDRRRQALDIEAEKVGDFLKSLGKPKARDNPLAFRLTTEGGHSILGVEKLNQTVDVSQTVTESGKKGIFFPAWRQVIPKMPEGDNTFPHKFGLDMKYLKEIGKFMKACHMGDEIIEFHYADEKAYGPVIIKPIGKDNDNLLRLHDMSCTFLVMPCRI